MVAEESDADMRAMAQEELTSLEARLKAVEEDLKFLLIPKDPNDDKNVILEIRAGTGGDEASLFVAEMFRLYTPLCRAAAMEGGSVVELRVRRRRDERSHRAHRGQGRIFQAEI